MISIKNQIPIDKNLWYAARCKWRCETIVSQKLNQIGIEAYVPILESLKLFSTKKKVVGKVLIPNHVFVKIRRSQYIPLLQQHHVYGLLNFSGIVNPIPLHEMETMQKVVGEFDDVQITHGNFEKGDQVQIIRGELTGLHGILLEKQKHKVQIELSSIGMGLVISVDPKYILKNGSAVSREFNVSVGRYADIY